MVGTIKQNTKRKAKERPKDANLQDPKTRREF
jgi:hypothetical protein